MIGVFLKEVALGSLESQMNGGNVISTESPYMIGYLNHYRIAIKACWCVTGALQHQESDSTTLFFALT
jgi:hypothetical protein